MVIAREQESHHASRATAPGGKIKLTSSPSRNLATRQLPAAFVYQARIETLNRIREHFENEAPTKKVKKWKVHRRKRKKFLVRACGSVIRLPRGGLVGIIIVLFVALFVFLIWWENSGIEIFPLSEWFR